jgi:hypothetical protein
MTLRRVVTAVPLRLAAFCAALVVAGCGADPVPSSPVGPAATGPNPPGSVASSAGSAPDLCAIVPRDQLTAIAADLDAGRPGSGSPTGDRSCMFASASDPTTTVELGLRADVADPIGLLEPKALSVDNRRYLPDLGDAAYYDPSAGELKVALDTRVLSIKVRYGPAKTESEATFAALGATAVAALGWTAPTAPSVDPCSLASPAELSGLINDLADGERRRINTEFGAGAACHLRSMSMGHAGSVRISVVDGVDPSAAAATVAKLKPLPEIGPDVYSDAGTVTILDGDRVVTVRVTVGARTGGADAGTTVGRLVAGHLGLAGAATTPADRAPSEPGPAEPGPAEPGPAETTTVESGSANPAPAAGGICTLVPQE